MIVSLEQLFPTHVSPAELATIPGFNSLRTKFKQTNVRSLSVLKLLVDKLQDFVFTGNYHCRSLGLVKEDNPIKICLKCSWP